MPSGAKAGDRVDVKLPDDFDDGTVWGDNAAMHAESGPPLPPPPFHSGHPLQSASMDASIVSMVANRARVAVSPESGPPGPTQEVINGMEVKDVLSSSARKTADMSTLQGQRSRVRQISTSGHPPI